MKDRIKNICDGLYQISGKVLVALSLVLFSILAVMNLLMSTYFDATYAEKPKFRLDNIALFVVLSVITILVFMMADKKQAIEKASPKKLLAILGVYTIILGVCWVFASCNYPVADRAFVAKIPAEFISGNYSSLGIGNYLYKYPYQLGIIALVELVYRVTGSTNYMSIEVLNVFAVIVVFYACYRIARLLFKKSTKISNLTIIFYFGCLAAVFYCTYVYGNLIGLAFVCLAMMFELKFFANRKIRDLILAVICVVIGTILKNNYSIILMAMVLLLAVDFFKTRSIISICFAAIMISSYMLSMTLLFSFYEQRSGFQVNEGVPKVMWVAMGLQDGWFGKGSYNAYTVDTYKAYNYDEKATEEAGRENIKERIEYFMEHKGEAISFFSSKIAFQWTEPTYMSIWESNCSSNHTKEVSPFVSSIYVGFWHNVIVGCMNFYQSAVWVCAAVFVWCRKKQLNAYQMVLGMIIIGGFLFHTFWEAKSQYIIQYFILAVPYAAGGFTEILGFNKRLMHRYFEKKLENIE